MNRLIAVTTALVLATVAYTTPTGAASEEPPAPSVRTAETAGPRATVLNDTALAGLGSGSAIGPDHALYVTNGTDGTLIRIHRRTGSATVVGRGLPPQIIGIGGMVPAFLFPRPLVPPMQVFAGVVKYPVQQPLGSLLEVQPVNGFQEGCY